MFRRLLFFGVSTLAVMVALGTPGQTHAQRGRGGFANRTPPTFRGTTPNFRGTTPNFRGNFDRDDRTFGRRFDRDDRTFGRRFDRDDRTFGRRFDRDDRTFGRRFDRDERLFLPGSNGGRILTPGFNGGFFVPRTTNGLIDPRFMMGFPPGFFAF